MARSLPISLSPHICVSASPDVDELFSNHDLPPLSRILQAFTPLSQVNTRTIALTTVSHSAFHLRFSDLTEIEQACKEDPTRRAVRAIDWVSERIARNCSSWLGTTEGNDLPTSSSTRSGDAGSGSGLRIVHDVPNPAPVSWRTPWWNEVRRSAEGERVPNRTEGWNHPVAVVVAVSTTIPNPLQAASALHARPSELPAWVDPTHFRYTVVIHPEGDSLLSDDETVALFNGIRKQFGLNTYLLRLSLSKDLAAPVQMASPAILPKLPSEEMDAEEGASQTSSHNKRSTEETGVTLDRKDAQEIEQFVREFVVQGLVPWMERAVTEWNETYSSSRRLPSRLFSSTRRLFGTGYSSSPASALTHHRSSTLNQSSAQAYGSSSVGPNNIGGGSGAISEQRRLAEFATVLGDYKLATYVWETLRKDGKGGSDILPLLLAPAPGVQLHAQLALQSLSPVQQQSGGTLPHVLWNALRYVARWEEGIPMEDFMGEMLEGDRWLVWAAGNAEDPPAALLLAQAAHLSAIKHSKRKASLLYLTAANRLEKSGIKPLTMYCLRRAQELYTFKAEKDLSPSFWDADDQTPENWQGFEGIRLGIDVALARLLYTSGKLEEAVKIYLRLLEPLPLGPRHILPDGSDQALIEAQHRGQILLGDFDVAFKHFLSTPGGRERLTNLKLPFNLCIPQKSRIRSPRHSLEADDTLWLPRENDWKAYWKTQGSEQLLSSGKVAVGETFWLDIMMINPLHVEVNITNFTAKVEDAAGSNEDVQDQVDIEVLSEIVLHPLEKRTVPLAVTAKSTGTFAFAELSFDFMSILPTSQSLKSRGPRLNATLSQRQQRAYGPDVRIAVQVEDAQMRLEAYFVDDGHLSLFEGERKLMQILVSNEGTQDIGEVYLVSGDEEVLLSQQVTTSEFLLATSEEVILPSDNSLVSKGPLRLPLKPGRDNTTLAPKEHTTVTILMRAGSPVRDGQLSWLLVYRGSGGDAFHSIRMSRSYDVSPLLSTNIIANPSQSQSHMYTLNLQLANISAAYDVNIVQIMAISPQWTVISDAVEEFQIPVDQAATRFFTANPWSKSSPASEVYNFVRDQVTRVVQGQLPESASPPPINLVCSFTMPSHTDHPDLEHCLLANSIHLCNARMVSRSLATAHPHIPSELHPSIFPAWHPATLQLVLLWEIPSESRRGHVIASVGELGADHASFRGILSEQREATVKRSMYAETQAERRDVLKTLEESVWNREMNPLTVTIQNVQIRHDFSQGSCYPVAKFVIRNFSATHTSRFALKLHNKPQERPDEHVDVPRYVGRRTFRGELPPHGTAEVSPKLWVDRAGSYQLNSWSLETELEEMLGAGIDQPPAQANKLQYQQSCGIERRVYLTVTDI